MDEWGARGEALRKEGYQPKNVKNSQERWQELDGNNKEKNQLNKDLTLFVGYGNSINIDIHFGFHEPMPNENKKPKQVEFTFETDQNYRILAANGVWGGITPRGDIKLDFFVESQSTPERVTHKIDENGSLGEEIGREPNSVYSRKLQCSVLLSAEHAASLALFIKEKVEELNKAKGKK